MEEIARSAASPLPTFSGGRDWRSYSSSGFAAARYWSGSKSVERYVSGSNAI
jgi:hypothetical protein